MKNEFINESLKFCSITQFNVFEKLVKDEYTPVSKFNQLEFACGP